MTDDGDLDLDLQAVLAGARLPAGYSRVDRIRLLADAFAALARYELPSREAAAFLSSGGEAWLAGRGRLLEDCWRVVGKPGSHSTPAAVWRELHDASSGAAHESTEDDSLPLQSNDEGEEA